MGLKTFIALLFSTLVGFSIGEVCESAECCVLCCNEAENILSIVAQNCIPGCTGATCPANDDACLAGTEFINGDLITSISNIDICCVDAGLTSGENARVECGVEEGSDGGPSGFVIFILIGFILFGLGGFAYFMYKREQQRKEDNEYLSRGPPVKDKATANKMFSPTPSLGESAGPIANFEMEASSHNSEAEPKPELNHYTSTKHVSAKNKKATLRKTAEASIKKLKDGATKLISSDKKEEEEVINTKQTV